MNNLPRVTAKIFASNAEESDIGQFGSAKLGTKVTTSNIEEIQALPAYEVGWRSAVTSARNYPTLQEMNGLQKTFSQQIAYLLQKGIAEYDPNTEYFIGDICKGIGEGITYKSLIDNNIGFELTNEEAWEVIKVDTSALEAQLATKANTDLSNLSEAGESKLGKTTDIIQENNPSAITSQGMYNALNNNTTWENISTIPESINYTDITYGNGIYVVLSFLIGEGYTPCYSTDGVNWQKTNVPSNSAGTWNSITYGAGKFVAVGTMTTASTTDDNGGCMYSTDGINWTYSQMPETANWVDVVYGGDKFVAIAKDSISCAYSTDGINWTLSSLGLNAPWSTVGYFNSQFIVFSGGSYDAKKSTDGINWTSSLGPFANGVNGVASGDNKLVAICKTDEDIAYTENGNSWTRTFPPISTDGYTSIAFDNGLFIALNGYHKCCASRDAINWVWNDMPSLSVGDGWHKITANNGTFVAISNSLTSPQSITITPYSFNVMDGHWISKYTALYTGVTAGTYTIDLSNYLPNDGYDYEVRLSLKAAVTSGHSGADLYYYLYTTKYDAHTYTGTTITAPIVSGADSNAITPVTFSATLDIPAYDKSLIIRFNYKLQDNPILAAWGYRRIGTNI